MATKKKTHRFVISITFDKPTSKTWALKEVRGCIYGQFIMTPWVFLTQWPDSDPEEFRVRSITRLPNEDPT